MLPYTIWFLKTVEGWKMFTFVKLRTNDIVLLPCRCCVFPYEVTTLRRSCFFYENPSSRYVCRHRTVVIQVVLDIIRLSSFMRVPLLKLIDSSFVYVEYISAAASSSFFFAKLSSSTTQRCSLLLRMYGKKRSVFFRVVFK